MAQRSDIVVLIGMPGAGKTAVGQALAHKLNLPFVDLDQAIETDAGMAVSELLRKEGEHSLRIREGALLQDLVAQKQKMILATGGGAPHFFDGMAKLRAAGTVLWLDAPVEVLVERTLLGDRPLLGATRKDQLDALRKLEIARKTTYAQAHVRVNAAQALEDVIGAALEASALPQVVRAATAEGGYDVVLHNGHACDAADRIAQLAGDAAVVLVVDRKVQAEGPALQMMLQARQVRCEILEMTGGEKVKELRHAQHLWFELDALQIGRGDVLVALGGGALGDLCGFVAASWHRGMRIVQMPTTVLAMADASVGGKSAINMPIVSIAPRSIPLTRGGKNLIGAFHQPSLVFCPLATLNSLQVLDWRAGLAEIVKIFATHDATALQNLRSSAVGLRRRLASSLLPHLQRAIELKAQIVARDPHERGERALLNFGHTLGHAIEADRQYTIRHGVAVGLGMIAAAEVSEAKGWAPNGTADELRSICRELAIARAWEEFATADTLARVGSDKKVRGNDVLFIASTGLGSARIEKMAVADLTATLRLLADRPDRPKDNDDPPVQSGRRSSVSLNRGIADSAVTQRAKTDLSMAATAPENKSPTRRKLW